MDRLSSLSDDVLSHILSFLDIQSAVRTSILSRRWKYLYMYATSLDFGSFEIKLSNRYAVNRVLLLHKVNIKKFHLRMTDYDVDMDDFLVKSWIAFAVSRGVEELKLCIDDDEYEYDWSYYDWAPGSLFISQTLVVFNLTRGGTLPRIPSSVWLPSLKILHLTEIQRLDSSSMTRLFDGCPLLQDLSLDWCTWEEGQIYTIRAPMLRHLKIKTASLEDIYSPTSRPKVEFEVPRLKCFEFIGELLELYCIKSATALATAHITTNDDIRSDCIISLIRGLSNATTVKLFDSAYGEVPECEEISYHSQPLPDLPIFSNLLELEVRHGPRYSEVVLPQILQHLLSKSPNLETLVFKGFPYCYEDLREFVQSPIFTCSPSLKVIHVHDFSGCAKEEEMVMGFLRKAVGLQELKIIKKRTNGKREH
ncbi:hypothetical protein Dimus_028589 [Dionaea muscipula]